jgi:hypothetical protein
MFMELVPGYSIKPNNVLEHIWQCYVDADGKTIKLGAQVYYSTFLNAIRSFYDLEEYPINLVGGIPRSHRPVASSERVPRSLPFVWADPHKSRFATAVDSR